MITVEREVLKVNDGPIPTLLGAGFDLALGNAVHVHVGGS